MLPPIKVLETKVITAETIYATFSNIANKVARWDNEASVTSRHLVLMSNVRSIDGGTRTTQFLRFNGGIGMDHRYQRYAGADATDAAGRVDGANAINLPPIPAAGIPSSSGGSWFVIPHAFNTSNQKSVLALGGAAENAVEMVAGRFASNDSIASVEFVQGLADDYVVGSTFILAVVDERYCIEEQILVGDGSITFSGIPQNDGNLVVIEYTRSARADVDDGIDHTINDDVGANYVRQNLSGIGAGEDSVSGASATVAVTSGENATANVFGAGIITYSQYTESNQPHYYSLSGSHENTGPTGQIYLHSGRRNNTAAITKLHYEPSNSADFKAGSGLWLYRCNNDQIERVEVGVGGQTTITFADIPQNFVALQMKVYARTDRAAITDDIDIEFNGDSTAANYDIQYLYGVGTGSEVAGRQANWQNWMWITGDTQGAGEYSGGSLLIPNYTSTVLHKHAIVIDGQTENLVAVKSCRWEDTSPITDIVLTSSNGADFLEGTIVELEGYLPVSSSIFNSISSKLISEGVI